MAQVKHANNIFLNTWSAFVSVVSFCWAGVKIALVLLLCLFAVFIGGEKR